MNNVIFLLIAYLLGSIPFSFLFGELFKGKDIRKYGSGNLGATNAYRVFGKIIGTLVMICDALKSGVLVYLMMHTSLFDSFDLINPLYFGLASVIGHVYPVWFKFKGGKGVATSFGLLLAYDVRIALIMFIVFMIVEIITRYVSVASVSAAVFTFILVFILNFVYHTNWPLVIVTFIAVSIIGYRHRTNYVRLKNGTENRVCWLNFLDKKKD